MGCNGIWNRNPPIQILLQPIPDSVTQIPLQPKHKQIIKYDENDSLKQGSLKQGFPEIEHRLVNFSSLGPVPRLQCVNDKIKNIPSRKCFKEY